MTHDPSVDPSTTLEYYRIQQRYSAIRTAIRSVAWVVAALLGFGALKTFAGQTTSVAFSLILNALVDLKFVVSIALAGSATAWAVLERQLRLRKVETMQGHIKRLETILDPARSSSGLTTRGLTNPGDHTR
jgi:hypothetical protein